jgi:hypothetical protein
MEEEQEKKKEEILKAMRILIDSIHLNNIDIRTELAVSFSIIKGRAGNV